MVSELPRGLEVTILKIKVYIQKANTYSELEVYLKSRCMYFIIILFPKIEFSKTFLLIKASLHYT